MDDWQHDRIGSALRGENPTVMARLPSGFAVFGDVQWLPGYSVLLSDQPDVSGLTDLPMLLQREFLSSMAILGGAVEAACKQADPSFLRLNFEILGNTDGFLHAHIWPRYTCEEPERRRTPVWLYPTDRWTAPEYRAGPQHQALRDAITAELTLRSALLHDPASTDPTG